MTEAISKKRHADAAVPLHLYLSRLMDDRPELSNVEIARRLDYPKPNVIAMMRTGTMKIPINKIKALAQILDLDPVALLQRALIEYDPSLWDSLEDLLGGVLVTANELELIEELRTQSRGLDPALARNAMFKTGFRMLVSQALDEQVNKELADRGTVLAKRVTATSAVNDQLAQLCVEQAEARRALRRQLLYGKSGNGFVDNEIANE